MPLPDKAKKLILLLMDGAAAEGERDVAIRKLIDCLRTNFRDGYALLEEWGKSGTPPPTPPPPPPSGANQYGRFVMPFGKHRGEQIQNIPVSYLLWILDLPNIRPHLRTAIELYLDGQP